MRWLIYSGFCLVAMGGGSLDRWIVSGILGAVVARRRKKRVGPRRHWAYLVPFGGRLCVAVVRANVSVAARLLARQTGVEPVIHRVETRLTDPLLIALYGNAITLTPGTMTVAIEGRTLWIHGLSALDLEGLREDRRLETWLMAIEGGRPQ